MIRHSALKLTGFLLILTLNSSHGTHHLFAGVVTDGMHMDKQTIELTSMMDVLDTQYTPQCLTVKVSFDFNKNSSFESYQFSNDPSLKNPEDPTNRPIIDWGKPIINLGSSLKTGGKVREVITHINSSPGSVNPLACVTYMLPRPPDVSLLSLLTDTASSKRLTRYFLVRTQNYTEAEQFLLDQRLEKEENVAVLLQEQSQNESYWHVLIRQLLHPSGSPQVLTVNRWSRDTGLTSTENIFPDQMANFYGKKLTGVTLDHIPFSSIKPSEGTLVVQYNPCVDLFLTNIIARQLNFTYEIVMPADGMWGFLSDEGHFTGVVGDVEYGRAHFAFDLTVNLQRTQLVDFTDYYVFDALTFLTAKSRPDPLWRKLITPFRASVWVGVIISVAGGALVYHMIHHVQLSCTEANTSSSSGPRSSRAFMQILASFFKQALARYLWLTAGRVFLGFWFLFSFLVTSHYSTALTSTLAVPFDPPTINTLQELLNSGLTLGMKQAKGSAYQLFSNSDSSLYQEMFSKFVFRSTEDSMRMVGEGHYSYLYFKSHVQLLAAIYNNNPKRPTDIHMASDEFFHSGYGCAVPQGSPHRRPFNLVMQRVLEAGLMDKWIEDALPYFLKGSEEEQTDLEGDQELEEIRAKRNTREVVLSLNHLQGPFFILFFGFVGGTLVLIVELVGRQCK